MAPSQGHSGNPERDSAARGDAWSAEQPVGSDLSGPLVIGQPIPPFEPQVAALDQYRPDSIFDGGTIGPFRIRLASVRGYGHRYRGIPRQDEAAVMMHEQTGALLVAVADGLSAARDSHVGATLATRQALRFLTQELSAGKEPDEIDWMVAFQHAAWALVEYQRKMSSDDGESDAASVANALGTTLTIGICLAQGSSEMRALLARVGDSPAWRLQGDRFASVLGASEDDDDRLASSAVTPLPFLEGELEVADVEFGKAEVLLLGSDGLGNALGAGTGEVGRLFAQELAQDLTPLDFCRLLDFSRLTFDDDRTLIAVWRGEPELTASGSS